MVHLTQDLSTFGEHPQDAAPLKMAASSLLQKIEAGALPAFSCVQQDADLEDWAGVSKHLAAFDHLVLLGTGGSSLGAKSLLELVRPPPWLQRKNLPFC